MYRQSADILREVDK
jgi:hypothetical protein